MDGLSPKMAVPTFLFYTGLGAIVGGGEGLLTGIKFGLFLFLSFYLVPFLVISNLNLPREWLRTALLYPVGAVSGLALTPFFEVSIGDIWPVVAGVPLWAVFVALIQSGALERADKILDDVLQPNVRPRLYEGHGFERSEGSRK